MIMKDSFIADMLEDDFAVINDNMYVIESSPSNFILTVNTQPIFTSGTKSELHKCALNLAIAFHDVSR